MADKFIEVPSNLEDTTILKRFLNELVDKLNSNALVSYPISYPSGYTGPVPYNYSTLVGGYTNTILEAAARADTISGDAKNYITNNLTTNVLQNTEDLATITEQFGTFYNDATAAAWYGLTVKSGELISGFTVSGVDSDTTTPGTAGSVFAISADTFTVGRAIEDINDPTELAYVTANGLPYGTMYNSSTGEIIPAFLIDWNGTSYDILFNGKVSFTNVTQTGDILMLNDPISNLTNDIGFTRFSTFYQASQPVANVVGDLWIDTDNNMKVYTWNGTTWVLAQDSYSALQAAATAQDTADGKITTFYQAMAPTVASEGDIWFDTDDGNKIYMYRSGTWVNTQDSQIAVAINNAQTAQTIADGKAIVHYQASAPAGKTASDTGDLWIDTDNNMKVYTWNGTTWVLAQDSNSALAVAQSKNVVFYQTTIPTATKINDLWLDTDDNYKMYVWNGTSWVNATQDAATAINTNTTTIDGGKITTGSITANQIATNTITSSQLTTGIALINGEVRSSDFSAIGGAGFRLKSNAAGTSADPTIYGAYIKGGVISGITITGSLVEASTLQVVSSLYPSNYGRIIGKFIATGTSNSITSTTLYYGSYGSGYLPTRVCNTSSIIIITGTYSGAIQNYPPLIQRSINGGGWVTIYTMPTDTTGGGTIAYQDTSIDIANSSVAYKISGSYVTTLTPMICVEIYN